QTSVSSLVFSIANWDRPQTVTVTGQQDGVADGHVPYQIQLLPAISDDSNFRGVDAADVQVINREEEADLAVRITGTPNPVQYGENITYSVVLTSHGPDRATNVPLVFEIRSGNAVLLDASCPPNATRTLDTYSAECTISAVDPLSSVVM